MPRDGPGQGPPASGVELMSSLANDRWLSVEEIATYLGVKRDTVYKWIERKKMPAHKVGSLWKFKRSEVDDWVRTGTAADSRHLRRPK
jgi:excisionase family DNA binding protein